MTAWPAGFLSAGLALALLMQDRMTPVTGTTAEVFLRDEVFHYRAGSTVTEMKMKKCFLKAIWKTVLYLVAK